MQGFGNVGSVAAELLAREGCRIVAIGDRSASLHNAKGFDIPDAVRHVAKHRPLKDYPGDAIDRAELLTLDVDVLVPAALENVITTRNAGDIRLVADERSKLPERPRGKRSSLLFAGNPDPATNASKFFGSRYSRSM